MKEEFDIKKWIKENNERQEKVNELLARNPLCEQCSQWNPYFGCTMCGEN